MGREVRRVPLDFDWPLDKTWGGFLLPQRLEGKRCPDCERGQTHFGHWLQNLTYVIAMLASDVHEQPHRDHMHPWLAENPRAHGHAEVLVNGEWRHVDDVRREEREKGLLNRYPSRMELDRPGKDALAFFHGLMLRSYEIKRRNGDPDGEYNYDEMYAADRVPPVEKIASSMGMSSSRTGQTDAQHALLDVLYDAAGVSSTCPTCHGEGVLEEFEGQKAERDAWNEAPNEEPPTGEGWQLWETVSEGSPISPVFATPEELATWMTGPDYAKWRHGGELSYDSALKFVHAGWSPSFVMSAQGFQSGEEFVGEHTEAQ